MIYITGDTHGMLSRFSKVSMPEEPRWTASDYCIVCGDFGFIMYDPSDQEHYPEELQKLDVLAKKPYTILFVDGNHENFDRLYQFPEEPMFGGTVRRIRDNIFHLQRGQIYTIQGKTFFTFGGGYSMDKAFRIPGYSWWPQEMPTLQERMAGDRALALADNQVDYIITHTAPQILIRMMGYAPEPHEAPLTAYFDDVWRYTRFKKWFYGHFHEDRARPVAGRGYALLEKVIRIPD